MYTLRSLLLNSASCLFLATLVASSPTSYQHLSGLKRAVPVEQNVFFDINGADVEARIAKLKAEGYRPTSLSIHGSPTDAKYAGIWTKQDGNAYETILGANEAAYNTWLDQWRANGYVSTHVSATGSASNAVFAGVMEQIPSVTNWVQVCGLDNPYAYQNATSDRLMVIKGVSMYGVPNAREFCILGHEDTDNHQQTVWYPEFSAYDYRMPGADPTSNYRRLEADQTSKRFWRPVFIDSSEDRLLTTIFDDTSVGQWIACTDLAASQLQSDIVAQRAKNMYPIHISGAGSAEARYVVIFAEQVTPLERNWHVTGNVTGFKDNVGVSNALDKVMQTFMKKNSVRQAQVAASVNGVVIASKAYTWAESDRSIVQPCDKFLLGSVSKAFTYAAIDHLMSTTNMLSLNTPVYPLLGYTNPADYRSQDITVQHLLDHTAGYDRSMSPDIGFIFSRVARSLNQPTPATLRQLIEYVYARPLDYSPGQRSVYSNYGTMLLSYVLTNLTGETYMSYLQNNILAGLDLDVYATPANQHTSDAIVQETKNVDFSALHPLTDDKAPGVNGGDGSIKEEAVAAFGLRASAETVSRFLGSHAAYGLGGRAPGSYRDGIVVGARAMAYSLPQLDWALTLNTKEYAGEEEWEQLVFKSVLNVWNSFPLAGAAD
jgi:CubicO group peptidase (beta-lactamase class C family)